MNLLRWGIRRAEQAYLAYTIVEERPDLAGLPFIQQLRTYARDTIRDSVEKKLIVEPTPLLERVVARIAEEEPRSFWAMQYLIADANWQWHVNDGFDQKEINDAAIQELKVEHDETMSVLKQAIDMLTQTKNPESRLN